ncbi:MAG: tRNA pseudouridine(55) synthase TruB, partial [Defluviitaleaceae bacterium]|nr:tRNA pseudouridine(55) synthase TruB [Defluviitaleaceae bacterium]
MYNGILNIYKQRDFTSNDVVQIIKRLTRSKVGHTGTLDPQATGILPICLGKATKLADYIMGQDKEYIAEVILGSSTDTQDSHGSVVEASTTRVDKLEIIQALSSFFGAVEQTPPMYSAIKIKGKKLYEYARKGIEIERKSRRIDIFKLEVLKWNLEATPQTFTVRVGCSKGTYIRTLCNDIGEKLGTLAHMGHLLRSSSGDFNLQSALTLDTLKKAIEENKIHNHLTPLELAIGHIPKLTINQEGEKMLLNGNKIPLENVIEGNAQINAQYLLYTHNG